MAYHYKAKADGVLSDPYKFVRAGETVILQKPVKASWLVLAADYTEPKEKPITSATVIAGQNLQHITVPPSVSSEQYQTAMDHVIKIENEIDKPKRGSRKKSEQVEAEVDPVALDALEPIEGDVVGEGTGNQDVLS
jgi:hypothetical protein